MEKFFNKEKLLHTCRSRKYKESSGTATDIRKRSRGTLKKLHWEPLTHRRKTRMKKKLQQRLNTYQMEQYLKQIETEIAKIEIQSSDGQYYSTGRSHSKVRVCIWFVRTARTAIYAAALTVLQCKTPKK